VLLFGTALFIYLFLIFNFFLQALKIAMANGNLFQEFNTKLMFMDKEIWNKNVQKPNFLLREISIEKGFGKIMF